MEPPNDPNEGAKRVVWRPHLLRIVHQYKLFLKFHDIISINDDVENFGSD
jgi:hypothetical protein